MKPDEQRPAFCQKNLRPVFGILVLLVAATLTWAVVNRDDLRRHGKVHGAKSEASGKAAKADAISRATPGGGVDLITQPGPGAALFQPVAARARSPHAFNTISTLVLPSVVHIHATRGGRANTTLPAGVRFADPFDGVPDKFTQNRAFENVGSGVIIDSRGFILTNYHVIAQATDLLVSVSGSVKRDFPAAIVAVDATADLALLRASGAPALPEARLGDAQGVQVGDWVLAFGSPFGLEQTVTQGIISNRRKALVIGGVPHGEMLQTDAPINRGSSGGPLVDLNGEVVGLNTAIYGPNGVFSGTGFAIPVDRVKVFFARNAKVFER